MHTQTVYVNKRASRQMLLRPKFSSAFTERGTTIIEAHENYEESQGAATPQHSDTLLKFVQLLKDVNGTTRSYEQLKVNSDRDGAEEQSI